jgi:mono/diheme cytochrome c family protein
MRRPLLGLAAALAAIGLFTGGLAWLLNDPRPGPGAPPGQRLYFAYCVTCHGVDGSGSWRSALFLIRAGDLVDPSRVPRYSDRYLFDLLKHGGAPIGRPGMPAFGFHMTDAEIRVLVEYVQRLARHPRGTASLPPPRARPAAGGVRAGARS